MSYQESNMSAPPELATGEEKRAETSRISCDRRAEQPWLSTNIEDQLRLAWDTVSK